MNITDLPVGGCRRYDSIECRSKVPYRGRLEKAYWVYTDLTTGEKSRVDDIRCEARDRCKSTDIGWQSSRGIYRKGRRYYNALRLSRRSKCATGGEFTCHFNDDSNSPVTVNIGECKIKVHRTSVQLAVLIGECKVEVFLYN